MLNSPLVASFLLHQKYQTSRKLFLYLTKVRNRTQGVRFKGGPLQDKHHLRGQTRGSVPQFLSSEPGSAGLRPSVPLPETPNGWHVLFWESGSRRFSSWLPFEPTLNTKHPNILFCSAFVWPAETIKTLGKYGVWTKRKHQLPDHPPFQSRMYTSMNP